MLLIERLFALGVDGVFLSNNAVPCEEVLLFYRRVRNAFPNKWLGLSLNDIFPHEILEIFPLDADAYWIDDLLINQDEIENKYIDNVLELKIVKHWKGQIIGQLKISIYDDEKDFNLAMRIAKNFVDIVAFKSINSLSKTKQFLNSIRSSVNPRSLGMSFSDIENKNIRHYLPYVKYLLFFDQQGGRSFANDKKIPHLLSLVRSYENDFTHQK